MKAFALVLVSLSAYGAGSLGVGLDVLPVAYTFAANRVDFFPELRLTHCDRTSCRWATGHDTDLVAYVSGWNLEVNRLEVDSSGAVEAAGDANWFKQACLSVVALTLSGVDSATMKSIADTISAEKGAAHTARPETDVGGIRFYGASDPAARTDGVRHRCGAVIRAND